MMRRDINGKIRGDGVKMGQAVETGVTIIAPLVVGKVFTPVETPQSLKTLGGLPEEINDVNGVNVVRKTTDVGEIVLSKVSRETAADFYRRAGWQQSRIDQHLAGIDFTKPVEIVRIPKGTNVIQYQVPGKPVGNYFAPPGIEASELGINPAGRRQATFTTVREVEVLRSTASPVVDNWSTPRQPFQTQGGGTQYFVPNPSDLKIKQ